MDKLGRVWTRLNPPRRSSQSRMGTAGNIDDYLDGTLVDTNKVFEMFANTRRPQSHRTSSVGETTVRNTPKKQRGQDSSTSKMTSKTSTDEKRPSDPVPNIQIECSTSKNVDDSNDPSSVSECMRMGKLHVSDDRQWKTPSSQQYLGLGYNQKGEICKQMTRSLTPTPSTQATTAQEMISSSASHVTFTVPESSYEDTSKDDDDEDDKNDDDVEMSPEPLSREHSPQNISSPEAVQTSSADSARKSEDQSQNAASSSSTSDFKQQSKRRSSVFVRRGSVTMEPLKVIALDDVYRVYKQLGTGRFGFIKLAEHKNSRHNIALKFFPRSQIKQVDFIREYNYSYFLSPHPNIIDTYRGAYETDDDCAFFFVQEFCPNASLREALETTSSGIGESATKNVMLKVLAAVDFMHNENLVHRNLKAENILLFDKDYNKVKVTDFGLTRKVGSAVRYLEYVNSYHAPELCETLVNETLIVERSTDVWALGILIYYCLKGRFPWQKATIMCKPYWEWEQWVKRKSLQLPKRWDTFSEKSLKLFRRTLNSRVKDRWSVKHMSKCLQKEKLLKTPKIAEEV